MTKNGMVKKENDAVGLEPTSWLAMKDQAHMLVKSGFLPAAINTPEKAVAVALAGRELGIGTMESFRSINIIQGKPTISPQLMLALANRTKELENIEIQASDEKCVISIKRKGRSVYTNEFGVKEATELQLMGKDNYKKQKKTMFQWRALAANLRVTFPDVVLGLYTPEELGADIRVTENDHMEIVEPPVEPKKALNLLTLDEQKELFRLITASHIPLGEFKKHIVDEYGVEKTSDIRQSDYAKVTEWIIKNGREVAVSK